MSGQSDWENMKRGKIPCSYNKDLRAWKIFCTVCQSEFDWQYPSLIEAAGIAEEDEENIITFSVQCPNQIKEKGSILNCGTNWQIQVDRNKEGSKEEIKTIHQSPSPETDRFWIDLGKKRVEQTLDSLDKRSEFMLTTIAALITINFGLQAAFNIPGMSMTFFPQLFLAISAIFFAISHFPKGKSFYVEAPLDVKRVYDEWRKHKLYWHKWGYALFVTGLFVLAFAFLTDVPSSPDTQNINGTLSIRLNPGS